MEDGELSDSDCEPPQGRSAVSVQTTTGQSRQWPEINTARPALRKSDVPGLSSGSSDNDSDDDCTTAFKKKKCKVSTAVQGRFTNPLQESKRRGPTGIGDLKPHKKYRDLDSMDADVGAPARRKRGNMWGSVLEEQTLEQGISSFGVNPADLSVLSYRDVEAYQVPTRSHTSYASSDQSDDEEKREVAMDSKEEQDMDQEEAKEQEALFEMETFGTDVKKALPKLSVKDRLGRVPVDSDSDDDRTRTHLKNHFAKQARQPADFGKELERYKLKRKREAIKAPKQGAKDRPEKKSHKHKHQVPQSYIAVTETDSKEAIVNALVINLQEPKVGLMSNVVDVLGAKKAVTLMNETMTIEASGGLMVANGSRRRTPGGVFLFLLRNDRHIRKDEVNLIFKDERQVYYKEKRRILRAKRAQMAKRVALKLPQDKYLYNAKTAPKCPPPGDPSPDSVDKPGSAGAPDGEKMEDGELGEDDDGDDDDLGLGAEPELEVQLD